MVLTVDEVFQAVGDYHKFQWLMLAIIGYTNFAVGAIPSLIVTFITAEPNWQCVKGYNSSICNFNESIGLTSKHYKDRCDMPREAWTYVEGFTSTVTEYDLVCDKSILQSVAQSCYWVGALLGLLLGGYLSDKFGRRKIFICGIVSVTVATWIMIFPKSFELFIICRVFIGIGSGFYNATYLILLMEFTTAKHRAKIGAYSFFFWAAALLVLALVGYLVPDWRYFLLVTACLALPCLFISWFVPESIRWLQLHGKDDVVRKQLEKVAHMNRKEMPSEDVKINESIKQSGSYKHLLLSWHFAKTLLITWNIWFATALVYYGISYSSVDIGGNRYLNFALTSIVELPSFILCMVIANKYFLKRCLSNCLQIVKLGTLSRLIYHIVPYDTKKKILSFPLIYVKLKVKIPFKIVFYSLKLNFEMNFCRLKQILYYFRYGRKKIVVIGLIVAFLASISSVFVAYDCLNDVKTAARIILTLLAKFFISMSFSGIYIWSAELFPTCIRTMAYGTSSGAGRFGSFASSYIVWLIRVHSMLPYGIMGIICLQAAITALFLTETKGKPTLETLDDMLQESTKEVQSIALIERTDCVQDHS
ncbi:solute carrier family 22 member 15-like [Xenia sp. Carnegie-2017]|uniref:solute carrier family 22 member 15-like n=1 Tax=Xenia sp. Carnegie-2017 TaxID=2897299 RepID=UPI001F03D4E1|nr:solute carrier family 22 member 15-like [Xenia sp. Carnegie-2017]